MLVLRRQEGHWTEIVHVASGDVLRVRSCKIRDGQVDLAFDDGPRNFTIQRPERKARPPSPAVAAACESAVDYFRRLAAADAKRPVGDPNGLHAHVADAMARTTDPNPNPGRPCD